MLKLTSVNSRWLKRRDKVPSKDLDTEGVNTVNKVSRVTERGRRLDSERCSFSVLVPPIQSFKEVQLEV